MYFFWRNVALLYRGSSRVRQMNVLKALCGVVGRNRPLQARKRRNQNIQIINKKHNRLLELTMPNRRI